MSDESTLAATEGTARWPHPGYRRGHLLWVHPDRRWRWADTGRFAGRMTSPGGDRPCAACGDAPTPEGYDPCIGFVPGAKAACCGHGVLEPYVMWENGDTQRGLEVAWPDGTAQNFAATPRVPARAKEA